MLPLPPIHRQRPPQRSPERARTHAPGTASLGARLLAGVRGAIIPCGIALSLLATPKVWAAPSSPASSPPKSPSTQKPPSPTASARPPTSAATSTAATSTPSGSAAPNTTASAAAPSQAALEEARKHFASALALEEKEEWAAAAQELALALQVKETAGLLFHWAFTQEQLGHFVAAQDGYKRCEARLALGDEAPDVAELLAPARKRVDQAVAHLLLTVHPQDATVTLDGQPVALRAGTVTLALDPGSTEVAVTRSGYLERRRALALGRGESRTLTIQLDRKAVRTPPAKEASRGTLYWSLLGGGAVVAAGGLTLGTLAILEANSARDRQDEAKAALPPATDAAQCSGERPPADCAALASAVEDEKSAYQWGTIGWAAFGVGTATALGTWLLWPDDEAPHTQAAVTLSPEGGRLLLRGAF